MKKKNPCKRPLAALLGAQVSWDPATGTVDLSPATRYAQDDLYWACITGRMGWLENRLAPLSPVTRGEAEGYFMSLPH